MKKATTSESFMGFGICLSHCLRITLFIGLTSPWSRMKRKRDLRVLNEDLNQNCPPKSGASFLVDDVVERLASNRKSHLVAYRYQADAHMSYKPRPNDEPDKRSLAVLSLLTSAADEEPVGAEIRLTLTGNASLVTIPAFVGCLDAHQRVLEAEREDSGADDAVAVDDTDKEKETTEKKTNHKTCASGMCRTLEKEFASLDDVRLVEGYAAAMMLKCETVARPYRQVLERRLGGNGPPTQNVDSISLLLPLAALAAYLYDDRILLVRTYWLLKELIAG
eukprot:Selendium_serpulae@DN6492_c0_g1_i1.p1